MEHPQPDWPATGWSLTAPESYVLNYAGEGRGVDAFKLALKELVARRALRSSPSRRVAVAGPQGTLCPEHGTERRHAFAKAAAGGGGDGGGGGGDGGA